MLRLSEVNPNKVQTIDDESSEENSPSVIKMSDTPKSSLAPSVEELLYRAKARKMNTAPIDPTSVASKGARNIVPTNVTPPTEDPKKINLSFPATYCNFVGGMSSVKQELHQLLFPASKEYLRKFKLTDVLVEAAALSFQSVQSTPIVKEHLAGLEKQLELLRSSEKSLREKGFEE